MKKYFYSLAMVAFVAVISGCNPYNNTGEGAGLGGLLGAGVGGIVGHQTHNTGTGMLIGGALGAATGGIVGSQIQKPQPAPETVVVTQPAPVVPPTTTYYGDTITVNIPNSSGGYTAVVLKRSGTGYIGPQGEYYTQMPTAGQLQAMYGR